MVQEFARKGNQTPRWAGRGRKHPEAPKRQRVNSNMATANFGVFIDGSLGFSLTKIKKSGASFKKFKTLDFYERICPT